MTLILQTKTLFALGRKGSTIMRMKRHIATAFLATLLSAVLSVPSQAAWQFNTKKFGDVTNGTAVAIDRTKNYRLYFGCDYKDGPQDPNFGLAIKVPENLAKKLKGKITVLTIETPNGFQLKRRAWYVIPGEGWIGVDPFEQKDAVEIADVLRTDKAARIKVTLEDENVRSGLRPALFEMENAELSLGAFGGFCAK